MANLDFVIKQGKTFSRVFYWENKTTPMFKAITGITREAPAKVTAPSHDIVDRWRVAITGVRGMSSINCSKYPPPPRDFHVATKVDANNVTFADIDSSKYKAYTTGGFLVYYPPVDLTGYSARMKIRDRVGGTVLESLTSDDNDIIITPSAGTISLVISATDTAAYTFVRGVYDLELVSLSGEVTELARGNVSLVKEVTTA